MDHNEKQLSVNPGTSVTNFNPVDYMDSDEEIVDYLVDSYFDDPAGNVYARACQFVTEAKGIVAASRLFCLAIKKINRHENPPSAEIKHAIA